MDYIIEEIIEEESSQIESTSQSQSLPKIKNINFPNNLADKIQNQYANKIANKIEIQESQNDFGITDMMINEQMSKNNKIELSGAAFSFGKNSTIGNQLQLLLKKDLLNNSLKESFNKNKKMPTLNLIGANPYDIEQSSIFGATTSIVTEIIGESIVDQQNQNPQTKQSAVLEKNDAPIILQTIQTQKQTQFITQGEIRERKQNYGQNQQQKKSLNQSVYSSKSAISSFQEEFFESDDSINSRQDVQRSQNDKEDDIQKLLYDKQKFVNKKIQILRNLKKYENMSANEFVFRNIKRKGLQNQTLKLAQKNAQKGNLNESLTEESEDIAQNLLKKMRIKKEQETLLDDLVPGVHNKFPFNKITKLIQKEYDEMKFQFEMKERILDFKLHTGPDDRNKRLEELRKVGIEVDRRNLINQQIQKLKIKLIYE